MDQRDPRTCHVFCLLITEGIISIFWAQTNASSCHMDVGSWPTNNAIAHLHETTCTVEMLNSLQTSSNNNMGVGDAFGFEVRL